MQFIDKANIEEFMGLEIKLPETTDEVKFVNNSCLWNSAMALYFAYS